MTTEIKVKRDRIWSQELVAELVHAFAKHGIDKTRDHMLAKHNISPEATDAKLAEFGLLVLDPKEIETVTTFVLFLAGIDKSSRALALKRMRAELKENGL